MKKFTANKNNDRILVLISKGRWARFWVLLVTKSDMLGNWPAPISVSIDLLELINGIKTDDFPLPLIKLMCRGIKLCQRCHLEGKCRIQIRN